MVHLGGTYCNLGNLSALLGEHERALPWYQQAILALREALESSPPDAYASRYLMNSLAGRATSYHGLNRHAEAAADWQDLLALDPASGKIRFRLARSLAELVRSGDHRQATRMVRVARETVDARDDPRWLYNLACICSLASAAAVSDETLSDHQQTELSEQYGKEAVDLLQSARAVGLLQSDWADGQLEEDPDLDTIRSREDFRALLQEARQVPTSDAEKAQTSMP